MKRSSTVPSCVALALATSIATFAAAEEPAGTSEPTTAASSPAGGTSDPPTAAGEPGGNAAGEAQAPDAATPPASAATQPPAPSTPAGYLYRSMSDEELAYEFERTSLGGPIAITVVGGVISGLALPTFLFSGIGALVCHSGNVEGTPDCTPVDAVAVVSGVSTAVFGTMTIVGVVLLDQRSQKRTDIKNELWRRQASGVSLQLGMAPVRGGSMLAIGGRF